MAGSVGAVRGSRAAPGPPEGAARGAENSREGAGARRRIGARAVRKPRRRGARMNPDQDAARDDRRPYEPPAIAWEEVFDPYVFRVCGKVAAETQACMVSMKS